ncbi:hypothetical protein B0T18DRAFT_107435 [Schizothecium vesticola]|uniref:Uncharacterized protein n=1 Tax=Schizothecium vesticola TaxID=314040 RepID=A0AA40F1J7_9PEZI|nr:hypothetical protein B0T18DRAFT_107435 [Schizothecium vesticola]
MPAVPKDQTSPLWSEHLTSPFRKIAVYDFFTETTSQSRPPTIAMDPHQSQQELSKLKMKFTPLKVRGKKGASNQAQQPTGTTKHRPEESLPDVADSASKPKRQRRIKPRRAGCALIERLPLEILEHIFFLSKNTDFPKSSPYIGCTLSSRLTLLRLVIEAFGPTWDVWFGCVPGAVHSYYGWEQDEKRFGGDPQFQNHVLACHRVDVSVLLDAQKLWLRRQTAPRLLEMFPFLLKGFTDLEPPVGHDVPATSEDIERCFEWEWNCHTAWCKALAYAATREEDALRLELGDDCFGAGAEDSIEQGDTLYGWETNEFDEYGFFFGQPNRNLVCARLLSVYNTPSSIDMHSKVRIPDELLVGPLDWAKAKLLFWFVRQRAQLDDQQTWELTKLGYENLVKLDETNLRLVGIGLFCRLRVFSYWPYHLRRSVVRHVIERLRHTSATTKEGQQWIVIYEAIRGSSISSRGIHWGNFPPPPTP